MLKNFLPYAVKFLPVYKFIFSRKEIYFHTGENLFLPARKFSSSRMLKNFLPYAVKFSSV